MNCIILKDRVSIVIPCKNEINYIQKTLYSISEQIGIEGTDVIIADGGSTDGTVELINSIIPILKEKINIKIINGGSVSVGRNNGAKISNKEYILFIDADVSFLKKETIINTIYQMDKGINLLTCKIKSSGNDIRTHLSFYIFNIVNKILSIKFPFAIGTYFLTRRTEFEKLNGFDESLNIAEDFCLSKKYNKNLFVIANYYITQDDRRFKKMGYFWMIKLLINSFINKNNINFFRKPIKYWE